MIFPLRDISMRNVKVILLQSHRAKNLKDKGNNLMNLFFYSLFRFLVFCIIMLTFVSCRSQQPKYVLGYKYQGKAGPFFVYSNGEDFKEFIIYKDIYLVVSCLKEDEKCEITFYNYKNNTPILTTTTDAKGEMIGHVFITQNSLGEDLFWYYDSNGDGKLDVMIDCNKLKKYILDDLTWIIDSESKRSFSP